MGCRTRYTVHYLSAGGPPCNKPSLRMRNNPENAIEIRFDGLSVLSKTQAYQFIGITPMGNEVFTYIITLYQCSVSIPNTKITTAVTSSTMYMCTVLTPCSLSFSCSSVLFSVRHRMAATLTRNTSRVDHDILVQAVVVPFPSSLTSDSQYIMQFTTFIPFPQHQ